MSSPPASLTGLRGILFIANYGSDPTEAAVPWDILTKAGVQFDVTTENGDIPAADARMLGGIVGLALGANASAKDSYKRLSESDSFKNPKPWSSIKTLTDYDVVILPGGHDKGVKQFIESQSMHKLLLEYVPLTKGTENKKVLGAICHGALALAFAKTSDGKSIIHDRTLTTLPHDYEQLAYNATRLFLGDYYKTYPGKDCCDDVIAAVDTKEQYQVGPKGMPSYDESAAFYVQDERLISARWPGDAWVWSRKIQQVLTELHQR